MHVRSDHPPCADEQPIEGRGTAYTPPTSPLQAAASTEGWFPLHAPALPLPPPRCCPPAPLPTPTLAPRSWAQPVVWQPLRQPRWLQPQQQERPGLAVPEQPSGDSPALTLSPSRRASSDRSGLPTDQRYGRVLAGGRLGNACAGREWRCTASGPSTKRAAVPLGCALQSQKG